MSIFATSSAEQIVQLTGKSALGFAAGVVCLVIAKMFSKSLNTRLQKTARRKVVVVAFAILLLLTWIAMRFG